MGNDINVNRKDIRLDIICMCIYNEQVMSLWDGVQNKRSDENTF